MLDGRLLNNYVALWLVMITLFNFLYNGMSLFVHLAQFHNVTAGRVKMLKAFLWNRLLGITKNVHPSGRTKPTVL